MSAVNIARLSEQPLHIAVVNDQSRVGRGVAYRSGARSTYSTSRRATCPRFRTCRTISCNGCGRDLNSNRLPEIELRERFVPRQIYGDTCVPSCSTICRARRGDTRIVRVRHRSGGRRRTARGRLPCTSGGRFDSRPTAWCWPPATAPGTTAWCRDSRDHPAWVGNPWQAWEDRLRPTTEVSSFSARGLRRSMPSLLCAPRDGSAAFTRSLATVGFRTRISAASSIRTFRRRHRHRGAGT